MKASGLLWTAVTALTGAGACTQRESHRDPAPPGTAPGVSSEPATPARSAPPAVDERQAERDVMVREQLSARDITDDAVLAAMRRVPRHRFVLEGDEPLAYRDHPLPIVGGQTISQPYIVAFMTQAAQIQPGERCLEIGTGSGYQAAVLAELCKETYSIEYLADVAELGRRNLEATGYTSRGVHLRRGDGYEGWPQAAPFDAILVTAAPEDVPPPLLQQLAVGGRLVIPIGPEHGLQRLEVWTRRAPGMGEGAFERRQLFGVRFVPFLGR